MPPKLVMWKLHVQLHQPRKLPLPIFLPLHLLMININPQHITAHCLPHFMRDHAHITAPLRMMYCIRIIDMAPINGLIRTIDSGRMIDATRIVSITPTREELRILNSDRIIEKLLILKLVRITEKHPI